MIKKRQNRIMKAVDVVEILNTHPSASLVIVIRGEKRNALLGWMPEETCRMKFAKITMLVADCVMRKHAHQFAVNTVKPPTVKYPAPTLVTVTQR
jgi:hypothetical protein